MDVADAQFEADHVNDEVAERCHARRGSRPTWRSGETTGNQLKYLEQAKELVKHVDQRFGRTIQSTQSWYMAPSSAWTTRPQWRGWSSSISTSSQPPVGVLQQLVLLFHAGHQQVQAWPWHKHKTQVQDDWG